MSHRRVAATLFASLFAAQSAFLALGPVLPRIAGSFGLTTAEAATLRTVAGIAGVVVATTLATAFPRVAVERLLVAGLAIIAGSAGLSAAAPSFEVLAAAQAAAGAGMTLVLASAVAAAARWVRAERRARTLAWALMGQPAAWVAGMPAIGALAGAGWRWAFTLPLLAAGTGLALARSATPVPVPAPAGAPRRAHETDALLRRPSIRGWALSELLAYSAWSGVMTFVAPLLVEAGGVSTGTVGVFLGAAAICYFPANFIAARHADRHAPALLAASSLLLAAVTGGLAATAGCAEGGLVFFAACVFFAGGRTLSGSSRGLALAGHEHALAVAGVRALAMQLGNLVGGAVGAAALAGSGYGAAFAAFAVLFGLAAIPHLAPIRIGVAAPAPT